MLKGYLGCTFSNEDRLEQGFVIETSYFQPETSYKSKVSYAKGLEFLIQHFKSGVTIRVFCDSYRYKELSNNPIVKQATNVKLVLFDCADFKKNGFHEGMFGTMLRFIPFHFQGMHYSSDIDVDVVEVQNIHAVQLCRAKLK